MGGREANDWSELGGKSPSFSGREGQARALLAGAATRARAWQ